jgi:hypothetical protein
MAYDQSVRPRQPLSAASDPLSPDRAPDTETWADTFLIAGLVVALGVLVLLLVG